MIPREDDMTQDEINNVYYLVMQYLQEKSEKNYPSEFDLLNESEQEMIISYCKEIRRRALEYEPSITDDLIDMELEIGTLMELEHRIKPLESIIKKTVSDGIGGNYQEAASKLKDIVRYTFVVNDNIYVLKIDECLHRLENMGYQVLEFKNNWDKPYFKGINVRLATKDSQNIFEIQFHTPFAYRTKEGTDLESKKSSTRNLYIVSKDRKAPEWLRLQVNRLRRHLQSYIKIPEGAIGYRYNSNVMYLESGRKR